MSENITEEILITREEEAIEEAKQQLREARKSQSESVFHLLKNALLEYTETGDQHNTEPFESIIGQLAPKPMGEWGVFEFASAIVDLQNIGGGNEERTLANDLRVILQEQAEQHDIDPEELHQEIALQSFDDRRKVFSDFAETLLDRYNRMTDEQKLEKNQEIDSLPDEYKDAFIQMRTKAAEIIASRQEINHAIISRSQQPDQVTLEAQRLIEEQRRLDVERQRKINELPEQRRRSQQSYYEDKMIQEWSEENRLYEDEGESWEFYNGNIDDTIKLRLQRIIENPLNEDEYALRKYYADLQKWVGIVLNNDSRESTKDRAKSLVLKNERYERFKEIIGESFETVDIDELVENAKYLDREDGGRLSSYFIQKDGSKNIRVNDAIGYKTAGELPSLPNFEQTMDLIQRQYGSQYATGGEFELIDIRGNFHMENFSYWTRARTNWLREENPTGKIDPLSDITINTMYSKVALSDILYSPQFRMKRQFDITGDEDNPNSVVEGHWGREADHPQFTESMASTQLYELAFYSQDHTNAANYQNARGERDSWLKVQEAHLSTWISRGNWTVIFKLLSREDSREEGKDGKMGQAMRGLVAGYHHMTDWTEFYKYQEGDLRLELNDGVKREVGQRKHFDDNIFYKVLEADGSNAFLLALSSEALGKNLEVKKAYQEFICNRLDAAAQDFGARDLTDLQRKRLDQLLTKYKNRVSTNSKIETQLDQSNDLEGFQRQVRQLVFNEKALDKKEIVLQVQKDMITHLKNELFPKLCAIKVIRNEQYTNHITGEMDLGKVTIEVEKGKKVTVAEAFEQFDDDYSKFEKYVDYRRALGPDEHGKARTPDTKSKDFEAYVQKNEILASVLCEAVANVSRKELNYFRKSSYHFSKMQIFDKALQQGMAAKGYSLNKEEKNFVGGWAKNILYGFCIAGQNDTTYTGFDYATRTINTEGYLRAQRNKGYPVVDELLGEMKSVSSNVFDMLMVARPGEKEAQMTLLDVFTGGIGDDIKPRDQRVLDPDETYIIGSNDQQNVFLNNFKNSSALVDNMRKGNFHWEGMTTTDFNNNVILDTKKAQELFTSLWTNLRYSTDQHGMVYERLISKDGKIGSVMQHQFGKKILSLAQEMQTTVYGTEGKDKMMLLRKPAIAAFAAIIGSVLSEHRGNAFLKRWTIQQINELEYLIGGIIHRDTTVKKFGTRIPPHIWDALLVVHGIGFKKMMATEASWTIVEALYFALAAGFSDFAEEISKTRR